MKRRKILLGLTGSVATVLYEKLIEELSKVGEVSVILTEKSQHFVNFPKLCDVLETYGWVIYGDDDEWKWKHDDSSGHPGAWFFSKKWQKNDEVLHIKLRNEYSALVIAPCSMNTLAKLANGICDNLLTTVARAWDLNRPFIIAPAANTNMWEHPITKKHLETFESFGDNNRIISPQEKMLACGIKGDGALAEIENITNELSKMLQWRFPFYYNWECEGIPIKNHPGSFGVKRKNSIHTGVDLYTEKDTGVIPVEDGKVVAIEPFTGPKDNSPWWLNTDCLLIEGSSGVVCYGEINPHCNLRVGQNVRKGDTVIGYVKRVIPPGKEHPEIAGWKPNMLHLELYPHGTLKASDEFDENLLIDPTQYLLESVGNPRKIFYGI